MSKSDRYLSALSDTVGALATVGELGAQAYKTSLWDELDRVYGEATLASNPREHLARMAAVALALIVETCGE